MNGTISWRETTAAILPFLLIGGLSLLSALSASELFQILSRWIYYGSVLIIFLALLFAWRRGWPPWSASWVGFLLLFLTGIAPTILLQQEYAWNSWARLAQVLAGEVIFILFWLGALFWILRRWPHDGLLAFLPTFGIAGILYLEFVPEITTTVIGVAVWVWLAFVAAILLRLQSRIWDAWVIMTGALGVLAMYIYAGHFLNSVQVLEGTLAEFAGDLVSELSSAVIPLLGILIVHTLWAWGRLNGRAALRAYRLILGGVVLSLGSVLSFFRLVMPSDLESFQAGGLRWLAVTFTIGVLLSLGGFFLLVRGRKVRHLGSDRSLWLIAALLLLIPLVYSVDGWSAVYGRWMYAGGAYGWQETAEMIQVSSRVLGLTWLVAAAWAIGRIRDRIPLESIHGKTAVSAVEQIPGAP